MAAALLCATAAVVLAQEDAPLQLTQKIPLLSVEGRIDHFALDPAGERLFICALENNSVEVIDLRKAERIHSITGLGAPQGAAYVPEFNRLFVTTDRAIAALQKLLATPYEGLIGVGIPLTPALLRLDPMFDPLRSDPRFQKLCQEK